MKINQKSILFLSFLFFSAMVFSQERKVDPNVFNSACDCISKISLALDDLDKNEEIKSCISNSILNSQFKATLGIGTASDSTSQNTIVADKDFELVQKKLLNECPTLRKLLNSNESRFENSVSDKKAAIKYYTKGQEYDEKGDFDKAISEYKKAVNKDPKFAFAWDNMGLSYRKKGDYKAAIDCYKRSLELDPKGISPLMNMAVAYSYLKEYKDAAAIYKQYIEYYPGDPEGYYGAGRMLYFSGDAENGLDHIFQAYLLYKQLNSPYIHDAETNISDFYSDMKQKNQLDIFNKIAKKYNINIKE